MLTEKTKRTAKTRTKFFRLGGSQKLKTGKEGKRVTRRAEV